MTGVASCLLPVGKLCSLWSLCRRPLEECQLRERNLSFSNRLDTFGLGTEEVLMETVLLPMGRTMSQEEVEVLMNQTVQRVSDTLSVSADIAQHLLIHCKWNVDVLIQRYTEDPELLLFSSGLQVRNPQPSLGPVTHCPVCVNQLSAADNPPSLCCMHCCCKVRVAPFIILKNYLQKEGGYFFLSLISFQQLSWYITLFVVHCFVCLHSM